MTVDEGRSQLTHGARNYERVKAEMLGSPLATLDNNALTIEQLRALLEGHKRLCAQLTTNYETQGEVVAQLRISLNAQAGISQVWRERFEQLAAAVKGK